MQAENPDIVDTNEEYIQPLNAIKEPAVLKTVFRSIVIDPVRDFFGGIFGFIFSYLKHFLYAFIYVWNPGLRKKPFDKLDYKQYCKHSFELALLVLLAVIFMVKLGWIPPTRSNMLDVLNNDLSQMAIQFMMFLVFALVYLLLAIVSIYSGRLLRRMLKINISKPESDILYIYLNNAFFSIAAVVALIVRCIVSTETSDADTIGAGLIEIFLPICFVLTAVWSIRFAKLHGMGFKKGIAFFLLSTVLYTIGFTIGQYITASCFMAI